MDVVESEIGVRDAGGRNPRAEDGFGSAEGKGRSEDVPVDGEGFAGLRSDVEDAFAVGGGREDEDALLQVGIAGGNELRK